MTRVLEISLPEYKADEQPDSLELGAKLDELIYENFARQNIVVRCIGMLDHPGKTIDELIENILATGSDKYDRERSGLADHMIPEEHRGSAFYAEPIEVDKLGGEIHLVFDDFYHGALDDRGYSIRIDLIMIYDRDQLIMLPNIYPGHLHSDVFIFKNPADRKSALLGLIKILN